LRDSAASTVEQMNRHRVVFGKNGKHRANMLFAPVACRDAHPVLMQTIGPSTKTKEQKVI
jgi:hypothetical protein